LDASDTPILPPSPDDDFLQVSYSTDGQNWIDVAKVNVNNWPNFTVTLPISNWQDLQDLQVRIENISTTQDPIPPVYLDGMFLEAHYELPASPAANDLSGIISAVEEPLASLTQPPPAPAPSSQTAPIVQPPPVEIFDKNAAQTCVIEPFSQTIIAGASGTFTIALSPNSSSAAYGLTIGKLPAGISGVLDPASGPAAPATSTLTLTVDSGAKPGSFNTVVVYREYYPLVDNSLPDFCQFNVVVGRSSKG